MLVSAKRKYYLDYLKAVSIVFVVIHHLLSYYSGTYGEISTVGKLVLLLITSVHVPLFFVIAGYLCHKQNLRIYIKKKVFRVLIPYFTFAILKLSYSTFISNEFAHAGSIAEQLYDAFILGRLYWFCYAIFVMYLLAPLYWETDTVSAHTAHKRMVCTFLVLILLNIALTIMNVELPLVFQFGRIFSHFIYFLAGMIIRQNEDAFIQFLKKCTFLIAGISGTVILCLSYLITGEEYIRNSLLTKYPLSFSLMFFLYVGVKKIPENNRVLTLIGKYSLQIMLFDSFYKVILLKIAERFVTINIWIALVTSLLNIVFSCISCMIIEKIPYLRRAFGL